MDRRLYDCRAMATGASRDLSRAIAASLTAEGCEVVAVARNKNGLAKLAAGSLFTEVCDLSDPKARTGLSTQLASVDILMLDMIEASPDAYQGYIGQNVASAIRGAVSPALFVLFDRLSRKSVIAALADYRNYLIRSGSADSKSRHFKRVAACINRISKNSGDRNRARWSDDQPPGTG